MKKKRVGVRLFKAFVLCILLLGIVGVAAGGVFVKHVIDNTPEVTAKDILPQGVYDIHCRSERNRAGTA